MLEFESTPHPHSKGIGASPSLGNLDREIAHWIWYFVGFNQFLGGIIGSTIASQIQALIRYGPVEGEWKVIAAVKIP